MGQAPKRRKYRELYAESSTGKVDIYVLFLQAGLEQGLRGTDLLLRGLVLSLLPVVLRYAEGNI
jgi:hypothetical protein